MRASDIMTRHLITVTPEATVGEVVRLLDQHRISGLPVVDGMGELVGLVTEEDLLALYNEGEEGIGKQPIREVVIVGQPLIIDRVVTVSPDSQLADVARMLIVRKFKRVPVLDRNGKLVGVVSRRDILRAMVARAEERENQKG